VQIWQSTSTNPARVLDSFRVYTNANPSQESEDLLHDLERLTGAKDNRSAGAGVNRTGMETNSSSQTNRKNAKKLRRNKEIKQRAIGEEG
jgi:hypothetical protein